MSIVDIAQDALVAPIALVSAMSVIVLRARKIPASHMGLSLSVMLTQRFWPRFISHLAKTLGRSVKRLGRSVKRLARYSGLETLAALPEYSGVLWSALPKNLRWKVEQEIRIEAPNLFLQGAQFKKIKESEKALEILRNRFEGQAGWVIGNGPSLTASDLTRIVGKTSVASNKIYLAFESTRWRPDFFTVSDELLWAKIRNQLHQDIKKVHISPRLDSSDTDRETVLFRAIPETQWTVLKKQRFSSDAKRGFFIGRTVTLLNLQFAAYMGLDPIFLLGIDHSYRGEDQQGGYVIHREQSHFHPEYRQVGEHIFGADIENMTRAYCEAASWAKQNNRRILNASRISSLEVFPRIDFESAVDFD